MGEFTNARNGFYYLTNGKLGSGYYPDKRFPTQPCEFKEGDEVLGDFKEGFHRCTIMSRNENGTYTVKYENVRAVKPLTFRDRLKKACEYKHDKKNQIDRVFINADVTSQDKNMTVEAGTMLYNLTYKGDKTPFFFAIHHHSDGRSRWSLVRRCRDVTQGFPHGRKFTKLYKRYVRLKDFKQDNGKIILTFNAMHILKEEGNLSTTAKKDEKITFKYDSEKQPPYFADFIKELKHKFEEELTTAESRRNSKASNAGSHRNSKASNKTYTFTFEPKKLGLKFKAGNRIKSVVTGSQADNKGVKADWIVVKVAGKKTNVSARKDDPGSAYSLTTAAKKEGKPFEIVFKEN